MIAETTNSEELVVVILSSLGDANFSLLERNQLHSCQNATALAAATFRLSTPWDMGIFTV